MNPVTTFVAVLVGVVPIAAAIVGIVPNLGRLRRLERIVDVIPKVDDEEARDRLKAMRDRIITAMEPSDRLKRIRSFVVFGVGYFLLVVGFAMWIWSPSPFKQFGSVVELVGLGVVVVGFFVSALPALLHAIRRENQLKKQADDIERRLSEIENPPSNPAD